MKLSNVKEIILHHEAEWTRMMAEENDRQSLLRYGITLLALVYALVFVLTFIAAQSVMAVIPFSFTYVISSAIVEFALSVASLYFMPQILAALAPSFGGKNDLMKALKLYLFVSTPAWIGMSIAMFPVLGWLAALAGIVYAIYLFWQHFGDALGIPEDKKIAYICAAIIIMLVLHIVINKIGSGVAQTLAPSSVFQMGPNI
jgi:hypothetical protein